MRTRPYDIALPLVLTAFSGPVSGMGYLHVPRTAINYVEAARAEDSACVPRSPETPREIYLDRTARPCYCAAFLPGEIIHPDTPDSWEWKLADDTCEGLDADHCYRDGGCAVENAFDPGYRKFFGCAINTDDGIASPAALRREENGEKNHGVNAHCPFYREGMPNQMCRDPAADR